MLLDVILILGADVIKLLLDEILILGADVIDEILILGAEKPIFPAEFVITGSFESGALGGDETGRGGLKGFMI